jgi:adenosylcobinamide-phosphate synthase
LEKILRKCFRVEKGCKSKREIAAGAVLAVVVVVVSGVLPLGLLAIAYYLNRYVGLLVESVLCYFMFATKSLKDESMKVYYALQEGDCEHRLEHGRRAVSMIVGRDTNRLDEKGVIKAAIETIAENFSDAVAAPMFYMSLGGVPLMYVYKAVNTMDSMLGYKNDDYYYFGRVAARLDDVFNFIPSRLSAFCMMIATLFTGMDFKGALRIFKRDRLNHASPNSAQTESVAAGALGVMLGGDAYYFGKLYHKKTIGDDTRAVEINDIKKMNRLMYASAFVALILFGGIKICIHMAVIFTV